MYSVFKKGGISLIVLIITIIVILVLAGAIILSIANNNPINSASEAMILSSVGSVQDSLDLLRLQSMSQTYEYPTVSELIDKGVVAQLSLTDSNGNTDLYNVVIIERIRITR